MGQVRTQHVTDVNDDGTSLRRKGRKDISDSETRVGVSSRTDLQTVFAVPLEQQRQTSNVRMTARSPSAHRILRCWVVNKSELGQAIRLGRVICESEIVFSKPEGDRKARH